MKFPESDTAMFGMLWEVDDIISKSQVALMKVVRNTMREELGKSRDLKKSIKTGRLPVE